MFHINGNPIGGFAAINGGINRIFSTGNNTGNTVAHELGHYFSLLHTHTLVRDTVTGSNGQDSTIFRIAFPSEHCIDDGICDTPVDPGIGNCGTSCTASPCTVNGYTYSPDRQNIMSYYSSICGSSFSPIQLSVMQNNLLTEPNKAYLLNAPTSCVPFTIAEQGVVEKIKSDNGDITVPMTSVNIDIIESGMTCQTETDGTDPNFFYRPSDCNYYIPESVTTKIQPQRERAFYWDNTFWGINGVTTYDQLLVQQHILGITTLGSPYPKIAADVNRSGSITSYDLVLIQRVILGNDLTFSVTKSWQYVPSHYLENTSFKNAFDANPFTAVYNGSKTYNGTNSYLNDIDINLSNASASNNTTWSFKAIKMGDINYNSILYGQQSSFRGQEHLAESRNNEQTKISYSIESLTQNCIEEGEEFTIEVIAENQSDIAAYQLGFSFDKEKLAISKVQRSSFGDFSLDNFGLTQLDKGELRANWVNKKGINLKINNDNKKLFKLRLKALKGICSLEEMIKLDDNILESFFLDERGEQVEGQIIFELKSTGNNNRINNNILLNIYPNPSNSSSDLSFQFQLEKTQQVQIIIRDQFGNSISKEEALNEGVHQINFNNTKNLNFGPLFYKVILGKEIINGTIIKH